MSDKPTKCECRAVSNKDHFEHYHLIRCDWCKGLEESVAVAEFRESELRKDVQRLEAEITRLREQEGGLRFDMETFRQQRDAERAEVARLRERLEVEIGNTDRLREQVEGMQVGVLKTARRHVSETDKLQAQLQAAKAVVEFADNHLCTVCSYGALRYIDAYRATQKGGA